MSSHPITLALELSQQVGSVAISDNKGTVVSRAVSMGRGDEDKVMSSIAAIAEELDILASNIELVIVSIGPGGFTSLRSSVAIAKMISLACGAAIVPVETAIPIASSADCGDGPFLVVTSVKDDEFWLSRVRRSGGKWSCEATLSTSNELKQHNHAVDRVFADAFLPNTAKMYFAEENIPIEEPSVDATSLLQIGLQLYEQGVQVAPSDLLPLYPREPEAVRKWKSIHAPKA